MGDKIDDTPNVNKSDPNEPSLSSSQPLLPSQTSKTLKRSAPESPDTLLATQKQKGRQTRPRYSHSIGDLNELDTKKDPTSKKAISDKVLEA